MASIMDHTDQEMAKAGKRDGRRWRWSIIPWFIKSKEPVPNRGEIAPKIQEIGKAAAELIAGIVRRWHEADGSRQKAAKDAVVALRGYCAEPTKYTSFIARERAAYGDAQIDRQTAWRVARSEVQAVCERYAQLAKAYADSNQAARRELVELEVPDLSFPQELSESRYAGMAAALGISAAELQTLGLDREPSAGTSE